jgi:CTP-dependent riboflavin kinase
MAGYTKLFNSLVASTIWREDDKTRIVWITMLALKDDRHMVEASVPGLADLARVSVGDCQRALERFMGPDKWSRNQGNGGRRIEAVDGGWRILNGEYYRQKMSVDDRREYQKLYKREYRRRRKDLGEDGKVAGGGEALRDGLEGGVKYE